jgi:hypothetical protein
MLAKKVGIIFQVNQVGMLISKSVDGEIILALNIIYFILGGRPCVHVAVSGRNGREVKEEKRYSHHCITRFQSTTDCIYGHGPIRLLHLVIL